MIKYAVLSCAAAVAGMVFVTTDAVVSEAGAQSREEYCHRVAKRRAHRAQRPGEAALGAGLGSAAIGAIIGGITGGGRGAGRGAIIGGSAGAVGGAFVSAAERERIYNAEFDRCMVAYRAAPQPVYDAPDRAYAPEPWTDEWYDYCRRKFRSFNPETGRYKTYSGKYKLCR
ncbi:MAG: BA14K family protein [Pseudomonadota bacterium]